MISWFTDIIALAMNTVYQGDARAMVALFFVSALTEVGMPFPFVIDGVLVVTSYETGLWSLPLARVLIALLLGRQFGSAVIYWLRYYHLMLGIVLASIIADGALILFGYATQYGLKYLGFTPAAWMVIVVLIIGILLIWLARRFWLLHRGSLRREVNMSCLSQV